MSCTWEKLFSICDVLTLHEARASSFCGDTLDFFCIVLLQKSTFANIFYHSLGGKSDHGVELANKKNEKVLTSDSVLVN